MSGSGHRRRRACRARPAHRAPGSARAALGLLALASALTAAAITPGRASAFSDPLSFSDAVDLGGGGGRWFTGSSADGFGCDVCHTGARAPRLSLLGLPLAGYVPGASYEVRVEWPSQLEHIGLALELTDAAGVGAGWLDLPPDEELLPEESCEPAEEGIGAAELYQVGTRTVLTLPDCGARRARFLWTAPNNVRGPVRLSGGLVAADGEADFAGDGVALVARVLPIAPAVPGPITEVRGGCGVARGGQRPGEPAGPSAPTLALSLLGAVISARRRRRGSSRVG